MKEKTKKFFYLSLVLLSVGIFTACSQAVADFTEAKSLRSQNSQKLLTLSGMSDQECLEFIVQNGVAVPEEYDGLPDLGSYVKSIIQSVEANPNYPITFNDIVRRDFVKSIISVVNGYYGVSRGKAYPYTRDPPYELVDNWVMDSNGEWVTSGGFWDESYGPYNCYSYAIDKTDDWYYPGILSGTSIYIKYTNIYQMALSAKYDLEFLGYSDVYVTDIVPDPAFLEPHQQLICIRMGGNFWGPDYHLMKYNADDGYWYHKPGDTAPLRYRHQPADLTWNGVAYVDEWKNEVCYSGGEALGNYIYSGDIYYIVYSLFADGDGTESDPYQIENVQQLQNIPLLDSGSTYFILTDDLNLGGENWESLPPFYGHFDGDGFTVSGLSAGQFHPDSDCLGLFETNYGTIENLHIRGSIGLSQNNRAGLIAGINYGSIIGCSSGFDGRRDMIFLMKHTTSYAGGITGYNGNEGIVQDCINYGGVHGMDHAGD